MPTFPVQIPSSRNLAVPFCPCSESVGCSSSTSGKLKPKSVLNEDRHVCSCCRPVTVPPFYDFLTGISSTGYEKKVL